MFCTPPSRSRPACKSTCRPFLPWLKSQSPQLRLSALKRAPSAMLRWLLPVFVSSAQGALLRNVAIGVLDSNGTAASPGEVPASLSVGFTTVSDNTNLATVTLPSGLASSGTLSFGARRLEEAAEGVEVRQGDDPFFLQMEELAFCPPLQVEELLIFWVSFFPP
ncbi:unnamed protein product, partial [Effrenium voratum]